MSTQSLSPSEMIWSTSSRRWSSPAKSETRHSTSISGLRSLMNSTVWAKWSAPPSGRSSRSTDVSTTYVMPQLATASADVGKGEAEGEFAASGCTGGGPSPCPVGLRTSECKGVHTCCLERFEGVGWWRGVGRLNRAKFAPPIQVNEKIHRRQQSRQRLRQEGGTLKTFLASSIQLDKNPIFFSGPTAYANIQVPLKLFIQNDIQGFTWCTCLPAT